LAVLRRKLVEAGEAEEWSRVESDLVLQFITVLFFSSSLIIVFILFWFSLWCSWGLVEKGWRVGGQGSGLSMGLRWMALLFL
jgi:hypothetical protein